MDSKDYDLQFSRKMQELSNAIDRAYIGKVLDLCIFDECVPPDNYFYTKPKAQWKTETKWYQRK